MAFQLKAKQSVSEGIRGNVKRQIEKALEHMGTQGRPREHVASENQPDVKEARKCFKKVRGALRLVREDLGEDVYHDENFCFRDANRLLRDMRDAQALVEMVDKLMARPAESAEAGAWAKIRETLLANRQEVASRVLDDGASAAVKEFATQALARLPDWRINRDGWPAVERGLRRVYRAGYRALALAAENPSVQNLHEWRKQARHLRSQLQLLGAAWADTNKELGDQTRKLSQLLGEDHDLAILRETLAADPITYGGHRILKSLFATIDRQREELERQAFVVGRKLYKDPPKAFTSRIETYWNAWAGETEAPKTTPRGRRAQERKVRSRRSAAPVIGGSVSGGTAIDRRK